MPHGSPHSGRALSLERKLPLLMTAVLVVVLTLSLVLTYGTLTRSAESAAYDRLQRAARQVAASVQAASQQRLAPLREAARHPAVIATARASSPVVDTTVIRVLERARGPTDTVVRLPIEIWNMNGERVAFTGLDIGPGAQRERPPSGSSFGPFYVSGDAVYFWIVTPINDGGRRIGDLAYQRRLGGPREAAQSLGDLIGEDVDLYMRNASGDVWAAAPGMPVAPPARRYTTGTGMFDVRPTTGPTIVGESPVPSAPWMVTIEARLGAVHERARETTLTLALLSLLLIAGGAALSLAISRRVTRPLRSLTAAAEAISRGDEVGRVDASTRDEVGRLATSFNQMASEVAASRRELERRIADAEQARAEAERASRAKSDFLAVMSHELRTPLNAIGGYAQLLELGVHGPVNDAQRDALARLGRSQTHLLRLINDVLNFAKLDAGQVEYAIADVIVDEALASLEPLVAPQVRAKGVAFSWRSCGEPPLTVRADFDKLQQILLNVVTNAIKFTPAGGTIEIACEGTPTAVRMHVRDSGSGIAPDRLPFIFDPFVQGERALNRPNEGVGLGLAISRDLARGMDGDLAVESVVGAGSVFTLTLPRGGAARAITSAELEASRGL